MKVEIYNEDAVPEPVLRLRLRQSNKDVVLEALNEDGTRISGGNLLSITSTGRLSRSFSINEDVGLKLDKDGRLLV